MTVCPAMEASRLNTAGELVGLGPLAPPPSPRSPSMLKAVPRIAVDAEGGSMLDMPEHNVASLMAKYGSCTRVPRMLSEQFKWPEQDTAEQQVGATSSTASPWSQARSAVPTRKAATCTSSTGLHHCGVKFARSRAGVGLGALLRAGIAEGATADSVATPFGIGSHVATRPDSGMRTVRYSWGYAYLDPECVDSSRVPVLESQLHSLESIFGVLVKSLPSTAPVEESLLEQRCKSGLFPEEAATAVANMCSVRTLMVWLEAAAREPALDQREDLLDIAVLLSGLVRTRAELTKLRGQASDPQLDAERNVAEAVRIHLGLLERLATKSLPQGPREGVAETCRQWRRLLQHITAPPPVSEKDSDMSTDATYAGPVASMEVTPQPMSPLFRHRVVPAGSSLDCVMMRPPMSPIASHSRLHPVVRSPSPPVRYNGAVVTRVAYSPPPRSSPGPTRYQRPARLCSPPAVTSHPSPGRVSVATAGRARTPSAEGFVPVAAAPGYATGTSTPARPSTVSYVSASSGSPSRSRYPASAAPTGTSPGFTTAASFPGPQRMRSDGTPVRSSRHSQARSRSPTIATVATWHSPSPLRQRTPVLSSARQRRPSGPRRNSGSLDASGRQLSPTAGARQTTNSPSAPPGSPIFGGRMCVSIVPEPVPAGVVMVSLHAPCLTPAS